MNAERNTAAIIANQTAGTQRIVDMMTADKLEALRDKLQEERFEKSQLLQNAYIVNQLSPRAIPSYAACNPNIPVQANVAAYGGGCGCGNALYGF